MKLALLACLLSSAAVTPSAPVTTVTAIAAVAEYKAAA